MQLLRLATSQQTAQSLLKILTDTNVQVFQLSCSSPFVHGMLLRRLSVVPEVSCSAVPHIHVPLLRVFWPTQLLHGTRHQCMPVLYWH